MQNKLVNTDESINIDELEKSKTISLISNRSPECGMGTWVKILVIILPG